MQKTDVNLRRPLVSIYSKRDNIQVESDAVTTGLPQTRSHLSRVDVDRSETYDGDRDVGCELGKEENGEEELVSNPGSDIRTVLVCLRH